MSVSQPLPISFQHSRTPVRLLSGDYYGLDGRPVEVQVDVSPKGSPGFNIVGLPGKSTRESRERIRAAIRNAGFRFPHQDRILVNLAPAFQDKEDAVFDLPVALGILLATGQGLYPPNVAGGRTETHGTPDNGVAIDLSSLGFLGELGIEGELWPVPGALITATALRGKSARRLVVPLANADEVALLPDVEVFAARDIRDALAAIAGKLDPHRRRLRSGSRGGGAAGLDQPAADFGEIRGQEASKRALLVAAAGSHHAILCGPPGVGKTMLARRLGGVLPPLEFQESLEVTRIRSSAGLWLGGAGACGYGGTLAVGHGGALAFERPFRAPHHTVSYSGLVGGGSPPRPGEISLAHRGVLFLDELPEFPRKALEALRQPLEEGSITIARSSGSVAFPAEFILIAAFNPCPCGYLGHPRRPCHCTPFQVQAYRQRISGPLMDRFDLRVAVGPVEGADILAAGSGGARGLDSAAMRDHVAAAIRRQAARWGGGTANGRVPLARLLSTGRVSGEAQRLLAQCSERRMLSVRSFERVLRVARTIADLEESAGVERKHVEEALCYRELPG